MGPYKPLGIGLMTIPYYMIYSDYIYTHIYIYTWNPCFWGLTFKNEGHRGSSIYKVYILIGHNVSLDVPHFSGPFTSQLSFRLESATQHTCQISNTHRPGGFVRCYGGFVRLEGVEHEGGASGGPIWWLNQPIWKIFASQIKLDHYPRDRGVFF